MPIPQPTHGKCVLTTPGTTHQPKNAPGTTHPPKNAPGTTHPPKNGYALLPVRGSSMLEGGLVVPYA